ncbi:MAG: type II secretion system F family protein [bacterium]
MPVFKYLAKVSPSETVKGEMTAENVDAVAFHLNEIGLFPVEISALQQEQAMGRGILKFFARKPAREALVLFTRQLANMLEAGMTIHAALHLLQKQFQQGSLQKILQDLEQRLRDGSQFSDACAAWPKIFSSFYVNMLRAGETGGMLGLVLEQLADHLEKDDDVHKQIRAAMAYPILMFGMGALTIALLLTFVVPGIVTMFEDVGQTLPLPTRILLSISHFISNYWLVITLAILVLIVLFKINYNKIHFKQKMDVIKLRFPFIGALTIEAEVTQFARTMSSLLAQGVPVHRAFEVVVAACKNSVLQQEFKQAADAIRHGSQIGVSLLTGVFLPELLGQMVTIGEKTNQLETVLARIARSGAREVERRVAIFTKLLEPAMIILLGAVIGFIVFAMMMPIFQMDFVVQ